MYDLSKYSAVIYGNTSGAGTDYQSGASIPRFCSCCSICVFSVYCFGIVQPILLHFRDSDYPFDVFKLLLSKVYNM